MEPVTFRGKLLTVTQKKALIALLEERSVIANKSQNPRNIKKKFEAWEEIARHFNETFPASQGYVPRTTQYLKRWWDNYKQKVKKDVAEKKMYSPETGAGFPLPDKNEVALAASSLLETELSFGKNPKDSFPSLQSCSQAVQPPQPPPPLPATALPHSSSLKFCTEPSSTTLPLGLGHYSLAPSINQPGSLPQLTTTLAAPSPTPAPSPTVVPPSSTFTTTVSTTTAPQLEGFSRSSRLSAAARRAECYVNIKEQQSSLHALQEKYLQEEHELQLEVIKVDKEYKELKTKHEVEIHELRKKLHEQQLENNKELFLLQKQLLLAQKGKNQIMSFK